VPLRAAGISTPLNEIKAELFKALAHPVRVRVLELLVDGERPVSDLLAETAIEASNLSQQLAVLRRSGVVGTRREGNTVYYRLADPTLCDLLAAARAFLITTLAQTRDLLAGLEAGAGR
jgi:ArsR family transcriptional regulator, arsenate/arsenite/antimonite-responsive transcriptional repressor